MKTLVIVSHPDIQQSRVNKCWLAALAKQNDENITVHNLYLEYKNEEIDVAREQALLASHEHIVFQFPFYWFSYPPLLKKWFDQVLTEEFAFGRHIENRRMTAKAISFAISTGIKEADFSAQGRYRFTMEELLRPFALICQYIDANYLPGFVLHGAEYDLSDHQLEQSAVDYLQHLQQLRRTLKA
ncbi:NAD(P)H-dependent oxidoreductase [Neisseriaceae bacterium TC5R-5]|nr:NAD(P)H-dependent oxidoreductase [Neisseriaceae bacterium TC5R-5]